MSPNGCIEPEQGYTPIKQCSAGEACEVCVLIQLDC